MRLFKDGFRVLNLILLIIKLLVEVENALYLLRDLLSDFVRLSHSIILIHFLIVCAKAFQLIVSHRVTAFVVQPLLEDLVLLLVDLFLEGLREQVLNADSFIMDALVPIILVSTAKIFEARVEIIGLSSFTVLRIDFRKGILIDGLRPPDTFHLLFF